MKAFSVNASETAFRKIAIVWPFYPPKVSVLPNRKEAEVRWRKKVMNQEELAYDMKLAEIAKLNIFAPIAGDDEEESEEEEQND